MGGSGELRVALIGDGFMGKAHSHALTTVGHFFDINSPIKQVICARSMDVSKTAKKWAWNDWAIDWRNVVLRPNVDVVDICAPSVVHKDIVLAAASAGKHIFCEKPLARAPW